MPRGRPRKNPIEKLDEMIEEERVEDAFGDSKKDLGFEQRPDRCFGCGRDCEPKCAKGDKNQYKFCSIECFNKDSN